MAILAQLQRLFTPRPDHQQAAMVYMATVEQARNPFFFENLGVPDTFDGRFEMILLHLFLVLETLKPEFDAHPDWRALSGRVIETFFADMDRALRELGVGDTGVSRRVKAMASGFYGRMDAYRQAADNPGTWPETLKRNVYGTVENPDESHVTKLVGYIRASQTSLAKNIAQENDGTLRLQFAELD